MYHPPLLYSPKSRLPRFRCRMRSVVLFDIVVGPLSASRTPRIVSCRHPRCLLAPCRRAVLLWRRLRQSHGEAGPGGQHEAARALSGTIMQRLSCLAEPWLVSEMLKQRRTPEAMKQLDEHAAALSADAT